MLVSVLSCVCLNVCTEASLWQAHLTRTGPLPPRLLGDTPKPLARRGHSAQAHRLSPINILSDRRKQARSRPGQVRGSPWQPAHTLTVTRGTAARSPSLGTAAELTHEECRRERAGQDGCGGASRATGARQGRCSLRRGGRVARTPGPATQVPPSAGDSGKNQKCPRSSAQMPTLRPRGQPPPACPRHWVSEKPGPRGGLLHPPPAPSAPAPPPAP